MPSPSARASPASVGSRRASARTSCAWSRARAPRRARGARSPSAAAATDVRKISSVAHRELETFAGRAEQLRLRGTRQSVNVQTRQRMRRDHVDAFGDCQARRVGIDDEGGDAARARRSRRCARTRRRNRRCRRWRSRSSRRRARRRRRPRARARIAAPPRPIRLPAPTRRRPRSPSPFATRGRVARLLLIACRRA